MPFSDSLEPWSSVSSVDSPRVRFSGFSHGGFGALEDILPNHLTLADFEHTFHPLTVTTTSNSHSETSKDLPAMKGDHFSSWSQSRRDLISQIYRNQQIHGSTQSPSKPSTIPRRQSRLASYFPKSILKKSPLVSPITEEEITTTPELPVPRRQNNWLRMIRLLEKKAEKEELLSLQHDPREPRGQRQTHHQQAKPVGTVSREPAGTVSREPAGTVSREQPQSQPGSHRHSRSAHSQASRSSTEVKIKISGSTVMPQASKSSVAPDLNDNFSWSSSTTRQNPRRSPADPDGSTNILVYYSQRGLLSSRIYRKIYGPNQNIDSQTTRAAVRRS